MASNPWVAAPVLFAATVLIYLFEADRSPHGDELYHVLAAHGMLAEGVPRIADGLYTRAEFFTRLVAGWMAIFGDSLPVARLLSLLIGGLLVVTVFLWTRAVAGPLAAWIAAGLLALAPLSGQLFLWVRFYALHGLAFWLGAIGVYLLSTQGYGSRPRALALAAGCLMAFGLAAHLQETTLIGLAGIGLWLAVMVVLPRLWRSPLARGRRRLPLMAGAALALVVAGAVVLAVAIEPLRALWEYYRWTPPHNAEHRNDVWFYHLLMLRHYATFWSLLPLLTLLAIAVRPQPAMFCAVVFAVSLGLLSLGGQKDQRYIFFAMPFLFVLWGIALAAILGPIGRWVVAITDQAVTRAAPALPRRATRWMLIALAALFLVGANGALTKAALRLAGVTLSAEGEGISLSREGDAIAWQRARGPLKPWLERASVVVTTGEEFTLYYLDDYDVLIGNNRLREIGGDEFAVDGRTGRPVISTAPSLALILDCYPNGLILTHVNHWGEHQFQTMGTGGMAELILGRTTPIELPSDIRLRAFWWENPKPMVADAMATCPVLPRGAEQPASVVGRAADEPPTGGRWADANGKGPRPPR